MAKIIQYVYCYLPPTGEKQKVSAKAFETTYQPKGYVLTTSDAVISPPLDLGGGSAVVVLPDGASLVSSLNQMQTDVSSALSSLESKMATLPTTEAMQKYILAHIPAPVKGDQGAKGDPGTAGTTGAKGDKGEKGETGAKGDAGQAGQTGAAGTPADMTRVSDLEKRAVSMAQATVSLVGLLINSTQDVVLTFDRPLPSTNYAYKKWTSELSGLTLGNFTVTFVSKTATTITFRVKTVAVAAAGSFVLSCEAQGLD